MTELVRAIVITSINYPTKAVERIAELVGDDWLIIVVGDKKTPTDWRCDGVEFLSVERQLHEFPVLADALPFNHYARKNLGYAFAIRNGATLIAETDDDNIPYDSFLSGLNLEVEGDEAIESGWVNGYRYFSDARVWPRGFPLQLINESFKRPCQTAPARRRCPLQQYLADGDPDVDAIFRLTVDEPVLFRSGSLILPPGAVCPSNSQNTVWWPEAFSMMYLPSFSTFRMTDIWRSFVATQCLTANQSAVAFHGPTVFQERNPHDLMRDFEDELPGYRSNNHILDLLKSLPLSANTASGNIVSCYRALVDGGYLPPEELMLLGLWLDELGPLAPIPFS